jgi:solute carrier family 50 (sugar transporter)
VIDLRKALQRGSLQDLNPFPWTIQLGNCLGWCAYGYYTADAFVLAANLPGLVLSTWLNIGAAKLQYVELQRERDEMQRLQRHSQSVRERWDASSATTTGANNEGGAGTGNGAVAGGGGIEQGMSGEMLEGDTATRSRARQDVHEQYQEGLVMGPQERVLLRVLCFWAVILVWVGWFDFGGLVDPAAIVGIVVNVNLIFFYGAPLQVMQTVIAKNDSSLIHRPTLFMNYTNVRAVCAFSVAIGILFHSRKRIALFLYPS